MREIFASSILADFCLVLLENQKERGWSEHFIPEIKLEASHYLHSLAVDHRRSFF